MSYFSNVSLNFPLFKEIETLDSDFIVFSSKNDIPNHIKQLKKPSPYLSIGKMIDFSSQKNLLQRQKSLDRMSSEKYMKTIEEIKTLENTIISNFSQENSNIFTLGRPCENFPQDYDKIREIMEENESLKRKVQCFSEEMNELKEENQKQNLIIERLKDENVKCQEFCHLKENEYSVLRNKYVLLFFSF